jgi:hypothetical protein
LIRINAERPIAIHPRWTMLTRRQIPIVMLGATLWLATPAHAQRIVSIERGSPERTAILDVVRASVERRLGIKVVFVVSRLTTYGDWAFANLHPRTASGDRIDYRKTLIAKDFNPEQDSDTVMALLRRKGGAWSLVDEEFLPTDVAWEGWRQKYKLPRELFFVE